MDADQGNSMSAAPRFRYPISCAARLMVTNCSAHPHHIAAAARRGSESSNPTYLHLGTEVHVGEDNQVCFEIQVPRGGASADGPCSFMAHPETLLPLTQVEDPIERFVAVTKFYLSGWHIKPPYDRRFDLQARADVVAEA